MANWRKRHPERTIASLEDEEGEYRTTTSSGLTPLTRKVEYRIENSGGAFFEIDASALRQAQDRVTRNDEFEQIPPLAALGRNDTEL